MVPTVNDAHELVNTAQRVWPHGAYGGMLGGMDQHLLELAIRACGGEVALATALQTDVPAIDFWRSSGVPDELVGQIRTVTVEAPPAPPLPPTL